MTAFENSVRNCLPTLSKVAGGLVSLIGVLSLVGWASGLEMLIRWTPETKAMNPLSAIVFILTGIALWQLGQTQETTRDRQEAWGKALAGVVVFIGAMKLADHFLGLGWRLDQLLFATHLVAKGELPANEMAPSTALNFVFCGLALLTLDVENRRGFRPAQAFILAVGLVALLALVGYTYHVLFLFRFGSSNAMALNSAIAFAIWSLGALAARPTRGIMTVLTSPTTGGAMARRLLPMAIVIPWLLGALRLLGEHSGYYETQFGVSLFAISSIVIFTGLIWWNAKLLYLADVERVRTERRLAAQYHCTRILAESKTLSEATPWILQSVCETLGWQFAALWMVDPHSRVIRCDHLWHSPEDKLGAFVEATRNLSFPQGVGLPGRVWDQARPAWIADVIQDGNFPRGQLAAQVGLHGAFGFPIRLDQEVCGVMEFFSQNIEPPDPTLLEMFTAVGSQIGQFIERQRAEEQLRQTSANLQRSNTDLQQFAYVASHDLFEPLRMVTSYLQLLSQRYQGKLDKQAQEFIGFALDGAQRMGALIQDLLAYSRVEIRGRSLEPVDCEQVFKAAVSNLKVAIEENGATVLHEPLPKVRGDSVQLTQVFQNLIGNAIKFRGAESPRIEVGAHARDDSWLFFVRDNGIGIDPKYFDRIFVIFQRLHTRQEYSGTGMGLAICKKIIERHGGHIWVESTPGKGSTFLFTLPMVGEG